jgi:hypothetical protein
MHDHLPVRQAGLLGVDGWWRPGTVRAAGPRGCPISTEGIRFVEPLRRLIIQTIRLDPSGSDQIDDPSNLSRPDPSGADQIDVEHQATDLEMSADQVS